MLKKLLAVALSFLMLFGAIGCDSSASSTPDLSSPGISTPISPSDSSNSFDSSESSDPSTPADPELPDSSESSDPSTPADPELPDVNAPATAPTNDLRNLKNILIIGNSHAEDTFLGLPAVFKAEGYEDYTFGFARRGSHTITMHRENIEKSLAKPNKPVLYGYQKCTPEDNGIYSAQEGFSFEAFLKDVRWDIVYIQTGVVELTEDDMCKADRDYVVSYIKSTCTNPDVKIAYSNSWTAPYADDQATRDKIYANYSKDTDSFWPDIIDKYEFNKPIKQHNKVTRLFEKNIFTDSTYYSAINTGTAVLYAHKTLGLPANAKTDTSKPYLYRDSMHMSDYGRVLVAYSFFAQYMGVEVNEIKLTTLAGNARGAYDAEENPIGDLTFATEWSNWTNWEKYMLESIEFSRTNPWTIWENESSDPSTPTDPELPEETTPATPPANDLKNLKKILVIGNSHSGNIFDPLPDVFRAQGYNDYTFGSASVGGCTITMHKGFIEKNEAAYGYKISKPDVSNGKYVKKTDGTNLYTLSQVLTDEVWDIVYIQIGIVEIVAEDMCKADRDYVVDYIKETCTNPDVKIGYSNSWVSPYSDNAADLPTLDKHYGDNGIDYRRPIKQHNDTIRLFEKNIFTDSNYYSAIHVGTAILYANKVLGLPSHTGIDSSKPTLFAQKSDGRPDFLHLSTYGKILAAYSFFAQYTGAEVKEIKLSHSALKTQAVKDYIIEAVEYSRTNAWTKWTNEEA